MNKSSALLMLFLACFATSVSAATKTKNLQSPAAGVVCDKYFCADATGVSVSLTEKFLGKNKGQKLASQGEFDHSEFTFDNGMFCDVKEKLCRKNRYFGVDGRRNGPVDQKTTMLLFGKKE